MTDPFRKVKSGDPLNIPATAYNAMLDAAVANMRSQNKPSAIRGEQGVYVQVLNETGSPLEQFEILGVEGPVFHPREQRDAFQQTPVLRGVVPKEKHKGKFVVLQEPAGVNSVVRACISGLTVARVYVEEPEEGKEYSEPKACDIEEGYTYDFTAGSSGGAAILWIEEGTGPKWALIRIGHGDMSTLFPVTLEKTGGEQGDHKKVASWTYKVIHAMTDEKLEDEVDPTESPHRWKRPDVGAFTEATFGYAHYDRNGQLVLGWINEIAQQEACTDDDNDE